MQAVTIRGNSAEAIRTQIDALMDPNLAKAFSPTLAIAFLPLSIDYTAFISIFNELEIQVFGASSNGEFTDGNFSEEEAAILLIELDPACFQISYFSYNDANLEEAAYDLGKYGLSLFKKPAFLISGSHVTLPAEILIESLVAAVGENTTIIGGNATGNEDYKGSYVFSNHQKHEKAVVALILDADKIQLTGEAISGYKAVGTEKTITKSEGNWIYTIDDEPAMDILLKFTGIKLDETVEKDLYDKIGSIYPLQLIQTKGNPIMIPALSFNKENRSFMCGVPVNEGSRIRFSLPPDFEVIDAVIDSARQKKEAEMKEADALLIFSCVGRPISLGPLVYEEVKGLIEVWNVPSIGFFTWGEYGRVKGGKPFFHGTTVSWVALREKE